MATTPRPSGYPLASGERRPQQIVNAVIALEGGQLRFTGDATVLINQTTTVIKSVLAGIGQHVLISPQTAAAAAEWTSTWAPNVTIAGQFTIHHPSNGTAGRTWSWLVAG
jgi:hypothetical protein